MSYTIKNPRNYNFTVDSDPEENNGKSMTIPDQALTIRELYDRFSQGLPIDGGRTPIFYGEDDEFPDMEKMDLSERQEYIEKLRGELDEIKNKRAREIDEQRKKRSDAAFEKRVELEIEKRRAQNTAKPRYTDQQLPFEKPDDK